MNRMKTLAIAAVAALPLASFALATEDDPGKKALKMEGTLPLSTIVKDLENNGYSKIAEVEFERGVYEIKGRKKDGSWFEVYVDAHSGKLVR